VQRDSARAEAVNVPAASAWLDESRFRSAEQALWASVGTSPADRFLDLPATGLRVRVQDLGDGPPILFIHGANTSGISWATLAARLLGYRCLLLDRPGTGLSEALRNRPATTALIALGDRLVAASPATCAPRSTPATTSTSEGR
jgi:pimeloyl-ACP methyl ester carboxylesterase